jgi:lipoprotein-anchoring transpeptidase ErfK/SrfK
VSIPDCKLALVEDDQVLKVYSTSVGTPSSPSPTGEFTVSQRIDQPAYYRPGKVIPPGKANPLGTRWLGLSLKGFGIHGTNEPRSIGKHRSHGCIRLRNRDIEELFKLVSIGDVVELHGEINQRVQGIFKNSNSSSGTSNRSSTSIATAIAGQVIN